MRQIAYIGGKLPERAHQIPIQECSIAFLYTYQFESELGASCPRDVRILDVNSVITSWKNHEDRNLHAG